MTKTFKTILGLILAWALVAQASVVIAQSPNITSMHTAATATGNGTALVVNGPAGNPANTIGAAGVQIANSAGTFTITFETLTSGSTWTAVMATNMTDDVRATTATAAGQYTILLGGAVQLRARISACSSCSVTVVGRLVPGLVARVASGGGGGGSGDVVGPGSSTDNAVARFNLATGKLLQNSVVLIGDTGNVTGLGTLNTHTLPGGTDTFTLNAATQTLSNKTINGASNTLTVRIANDVSGLGTGIAAALGVNVGSAGAPVLFNGAGGTPSSLTLTNGTGLPLSTGVTGDLPFANFVQAGSAGFVGATGAGDYAHRTPTQVTAALDAFTGDSGSGGVKGLVPAPAAGDAAAGKFLKADGTFAVPSGGGGLAVGTTTITGGSNTDALYNNSGVLGSRTVTGSGNAVLSASPTLTGTVALAAMTASDTITQTSASATAFQSGPNGGTNPVFRLVNSTASAATGLSITGNAAGSGVLLTALSSGTNEDLLLVGKGTGHVGSNKNGGVAIGIQVSGQSFVGIGRNSSVGGMNINGGNSDSDTAVQMNINTLGLLMDGTFLLGWASTNVTQARDLTLRRVAAANLAFGAADAASPVAQTLSVQNVVAGTSNTVGVDWTKKASAGTGTGVGGAHVWQVAPAGSSGTTQNSFVEAMRITGAGVIQFPTTITAGGTTGNQTIDKVSGTVNIAAAGTTVTVTNNKVTANSTCFGVLRTNDATAALKNIVPGAGSFVITLTAATTAETSIGFFCINP